MVSSRPSSERTGSIDSQLGHQKKPSLQTKNDPNLALNEEQPSMFSDLLQLALLTVPVSITGSATGRSLYSMQHMDMNGQPISMYYLLSHLVSGLTRIQLNPIFRILLATASNAH